MTTKLKYSDLPPFRWYPVEAVEIADGQTVFAASANNGADDWIMEDVTYCENGDFFSFGDSQTALARFVMRLETPEQQATPHQAPWWRPGGVVDLGDWSERLTELGKHQSWIIEVADGALKRIEDCTEDELLAFAESEKARSNAN